MPSDAAMASIASSTRPYSPAPPPPALTCLSRKAHAASPAPGTRRWERRDILLKMERLTKLWDQRRPYVIAAAIVLVLVVYVVHDQNRREWVRDSPHTSAVETKCTDGYEPGMVPDRCVRLRYERLVRDYKLGKLKLDRKCLRGFPNWNGPSVKWPGVLAALMECGYW